MHKYNAYIQHIPSKEIHTYTHYVAKNVHIAINGTSKAAISNLKEQMLYSPQKISKIKFMIKIIFEIVTWA